MNKPKHGNTSGDGTVLSFSRYHLWQKILIYFFAVLFFIYIAFPFYWIIVTSFKEALEIYQVPPKLIPSNINLTNYALAFQKFGIGKFIMNSLKVTVVTVFFTTVISMFAAYALTRMNFKGKEKIKQLLSLTQMFPVIVLLVPLYIMCVKLKMYNSLESLFLPYIALQIPVSIMLQTSFFIGIPQEMEEAAYIDGCSRLQAMTHIILPLSVTGIVSVAIYTFVMVWQEFLLASTFTNKPEFYTLTVGLTTFKGDYATEWGALMATSIIIAIPALILFTATQNFFINNLVGGVKE
jgi:ABC-type glycerol-3-phosphate transport system permease component